MPPAGPLAIGCIIVAAGAAFTYLDPSPRPLSARLAMGAALGFTLLGIAALPLATLDGALTGRAAGGAVLLALTPLLLFTARGTRERFVAELRAARVARNGVMFALAALTVFLVAMMRQAALETSDGIVTRSLANRLDLTLHLSMITAFAWGGHFPPTHPGFAGAPLTYPFLVNVGAAILMKAGAGLTQAIFIQNTLLALALVALLYQWAGGRTANRIAAAMAPALVLFGSGLGWLLAARESLASGNPITFLLHLPHSYTLNTANLQWGNLATIMLLPQRSLSLGLPLALVVMMLWWPLDGRAARRMILAGVVTGMMPLAHTHSFAVMLVAAAALALLFRVWRLWLLFFAAAFVVAVPQLIWIIRGSAIHTSSFIGWMPGWSSAPEPLAWFWLKNTGLFIPLVIAAWFAPRSWIPVTLRRFYAPFVLFFILPNLFRLAPRIWDNNKVLIYWYAASVPLVALLLATLWSRRGIMRAGTVTLFVSLVLAGVLDAWRVTIGTVSVTVIDRDSVAFATAIREQTPPNAVIVRAPVSSHPVVLAGRPSWLGYIAQVQLHGLDTKQREADQTCIYTGCPHARALLDTSGVNYVVVGPLERRAYSVNEEFLATLPVVTRVGDLALLQVR